MNESIDKHSGNGDPFGFSGLEVAAKGGDDEVRVEAGDNGNEMVDEEETEKNIAERFADTTKLVKEVKEADKWLSLGVGLEGGAMDYFGLASLSERYGLDRTLEVIGDASKALFEELGEKPTNIVDKFLYRKNSLQPQMNAAMTMIWGRLEPDSGKRRELYNEMAGAENNESRMFSSVVTSEEDGRISVGSRPSFLAYDILKGLDRVNKIVNDENSMIFGDDVQAAKEQGRSVASVLTAGVENPTLDDYIKAVENRVSGAAVEAYGQLSQEQETLDGDLEKIEDEVMINEFNVEVRPLRYIRADMMKQMGELPDGDVKEFIELQAQELMDKIDEKRAAADQKVAGMKQEYLADVGVTEEDYFDKSRAEMREIRYNPNRWESLLK